MSELKLSDLKAMPNITPGDWQAVSISGEDAGWVVRTEYRNGGGLRCTAFLGQFHCGGQNDEANAKMAAASRDMYTALLMAQKDVQRNCMGCQNIKHQNDFPAHFSPQASVDRHSKECVAVRDALAKAAGRIK